MNLDFAVMQGSESANDLSDDPTLMREEKNSKASLITRELLVDLHFWNARYAIR